MVRACPGLKCSFCDVPLIEESMLFADTHTIQATAWICLDCLRTANGELAKYWRAERMKRVT